MRIAIFGITGKAGSRIAREALSRGHDVVGVARDFSKVPLEHARLQLVKGDVLDPASVASAVRGADAVISAVGPANFERTNPFLKNAVQSLLDGVRQAGIKRLLLVGGAGGLEVAPGVQLVDSPGFPEAWKGIALTHRDAFEVIRNVNDLDWTYVAPAAMFEPGERTGKYRKDGDRLVADAQGNSRISMEDYAVAMLDEVEKPAHKKARMSVGY
jgi:putative NADH-flavin reductase